MIKQDETGQATAGTGSRAKVMIVMLVALAVAVGVAYAGVAMPQARTLPWTFVYPILAGVGTGGLLAWLLGQMRFSTGTGPGPAASISLQDATGEAEVLADDKGRVISSNGAYVALLSKAGLSRTVGMDVLYAGYPDFAEPVYQLAQAARAGKTLHRDLRVAAHSSVPGASATEARWLRLSVFPAGPAAQPSQSTLWRLTDITADRNTQESAFARLQFIITYLDHAPVGFFSTLPDGKVDYVNATLADWLGLDLAEAHGGKIVLPNLVGTDLATQLSSVQPSKNGSHTEQFSGFLPRRNGQPLAVDIVHRTDFDGEGRALPFRSMVLRKADGLVGETLAPGWFETLAPAAPIGLARITQDGAVGKANTKFLELSPAVRLLGPLEAAVKDVDKPQLQATLAALRDGKVTNATCDLLFEGTPPRSVALTLVRPSATTGELLAYGVDRTENKALEVQLAQSQKMQAVGQLASGIAHDFNNVLTPIIGFADLLLAKMRPTDAAFADIMNIKQNANRAANLVRQLLAFSRKQTMQPKVHLLSEAMSDLGNLLSRVLGEKVGLDISHARDLGHVMVDINQFEQVIINLAVNGRDAMPQGGKLVVRTYNLGKDEVKTIPHPLPEGDYVVCQVSDTGTGIPKDILEKIWEPFFSTKDVGKGTGLGLSMVYGIIKQTGGYIYCDSVMGEGTTFSMFLPRVSPEKLAEAKPVAEKVEAVRADFTGRGRILVVEDEDSVRAFAVRALSSRGYTVIEADSGESALEVIANDKDGFELVLSDVVMPEMDGPTMLAEMRKQGMTTRVIFMSGYAEDAFERNLENPDDFAFLQKPFSLKQLVEKVKEAMG